MPLAMTSKATHLALKSQATGTNASKMVWNLDSVGEPSPRVGDLHCWTTPLLLLNVDINEKKHKQPVENNIFILHSFERVQDMKANKIKEEGMKVINNIKVKWTSLIPFGDPILARLPEPCDRVTRWTAPSHPGNSRRAPNRFRINAYKFALATQKRRRRRARSDNIN